MLPNYDCDNCDTNVFIDTNNLRRESSTNFKLLTYLSGATTALRSWPASGVSKTAHGLAPSSASPLYRP